MRTSSIHQSKELSKLRLSFYGNPAGAADYSGAGLEPGTRGKIRDRFLGRGRGRHYRNYSRILVLNGGWLLLILLFYTLNELVIKSWTNHWFVHWYVNDILAGIWLPALMMFLAAAFRVTRILKLNGRRIILVVLTAGLFWELIAPFYVTDSVRDPFDILAYVAGGLIYVLLSKRIPW